MTVYDLMVGKQVKVMTDMKVEVILEIKEIKELQHSRQITPDTPQNDWWGESVEWKTYLVKFTNGGQKEYQNIDEIKML